MKKLLILLSLTFALIYNVAAQPDKTTVDPIIVIIKTNDGNTITGTVDREDKKNIWIKTEDYGVIQVKKANIASQKVATKKQRVLIETTNENKMVGTIEQEDDEKIWLKTENYGTVEIKKSNIRSKKILDGEIVKNGKVWFENPNSTRNLYGPTGYGLKKGEGYYQNFYLLLNSASYGFTDHFTLGIGVIPIPFIGAFTITPKFSFPIVENKWNVGAGVLYARVLDYDMGIGYGVLTYGSRNNNITAGVGYGFQEGELAAMPTLTLSGMVRIAERISVVTENWFVSGDDGYQAFVSFSVRYMFDRLSIDFGFVNPVQFGLAIGIPVIGVVIPFGK
jgi:small nuclear ribonucleoprotein (snRNP)-like protein